MDVDQPFVAEVSISPHALEQLLARVDPPRLGGKLAQQVELGAGELDRLAVAGHDTLVGRDLEAPPGTTVPRLVEALVRRSSARMRADSSFPTNGFVT